MGKLDRLLLGESYDRLVLPPPKESVLMIAEENEHFGPSAGKSLFREILPRYRRIADQIEQIGYPAISDLILFCFNETSEYFTRTITDTDDETVKDDRGQDLDAFTTNLLYALTERSKPAVLSYIAKIYHTLAPEGEEIMEKNILFSAKMTESLKDLQIKDTRSIRRTLSEFSCQTYSDESLTLVVNYLNHIFNKDLRCVEKWEDTRTLVRYLGQLFEAIKEKKELIVYHSLERIADLIYQLKQG